ncbi:MAG TPA: LPS export ABC transporter permease LptF [Geobacteraceae bacterium]
MKKTLNLYLCREISTPFLLGMATFTSVLLLGRLMRLADLVVAKGVPLVDIARLVVYLLPYFCLLTIPMAFLLALLLAFGRLSADSEVTAMKGCGIGLYGLLPPVLACACVTYLATALIAVYAVPWGNNSFKKLVYSVAQSHANMTIKERVFNDDIPGIILYVDRFRKDDGLMHGVLIQDERNPEEPTTIFAETGGIFTDPAAKVVRLQLTNGSIHHARRGDGYRRVDFSEYALSIDLNQAAKGGGRDELDMTLGELRSGLRLPGLHPKLRLDMELELHRRFALPFACFVFALVGVPLGIQNQRSGKGAGFAVSIGVLLVYYIVLAAGKALGQRGLLPAAGAVWAPNVVFLLFGIHLFRTTAAEQRFLLFTACTAIARRLRAMSPGGRATP